MPSTAKGELAMGILGQLTGDPNIAQAGRMISRKATQQRPRPISAGPYGSVLIDPISGEATVIPEVEEAIRRRRAHETGLTTQKFEQQRELASMRVSDSMRKDLAQGQVKLDLLNSTIAELEGLQAAGGSVGREAVDAISGLLETYGAEQPARWVERAGYTDVEENLRSRLNKIFVSMEMDLKGAATDKDMALMRRSSPTEAGISDSARLERLRFLKSLHEKYFGTLRGAYGGTTATTPAQTAIPARPEGLSDAEWNEWLELKGYTR